MKKKYLFWAGLLTAALGFTACSDDDNAGGDNVEREFMTMFRVDNNTGKGEADPYRCQVVSLNDIQLYWYGVDGCAGYQIRMALQPNVANGADAWENAAANGLLLLDTIVEPDVLEMKVKDLQYQTDYRFAIRTLSKKGEAYHSKWYGYGDGRQWADYVGIQTEERYFTPQVLSAGNVTKTSMRIYFDRALATCGTADEQKEALEYFDVDNDGNFIFDKFTVEPSPTNPDAKVPEQYRNHVITQEDLNRGYIDVDGLDENSVYNFNIENTKSTKSDCHWDKLYNTLPMRTDGEVGEPILIKHSVNPNDEILDDTYLKPTGAGKVPGVEKYQACRIDTVIMRFNNDANLAEGQVFELEGGKTYYTYMNVTLCKGFTLRTRPEDVAKGLRARVLLGGMATVDGKVAATNNFMFGRRPQSGELGGIYVKSIKFEDIDFDAPEARNFGEGNATGNYFINMYSDGMAVTLQSFEMHRCTLQRMVRGFIRVQGSKTKKFEKVLINECDFYNCGYYDNKGRGYAWIAGDGSSVKSNIFGDLIFQECTFYDSPRTCLITDNGKDLAWGDDIHYNITLLNNTFVNFSTRSSGRKIFDLRYMPGGSKITCKKNLFVLTKNANDAARNLYFEGADIRSINGSGILYTDFEDNYSTNVNGNGETIGDDGIFTSASFTAKKNSIATWIEDNSILETLIVKVGNDGGISPTELMKNPNPPHMLTNGADDHRVDNLDGLYFNNTDKVRNSDIYKKGIGASKWRSTVK